MLGSEQVLAKGCGGGWGDMMGTLSGQGKGEVGATDRVWGGPPQYRPGVLSPCPPSAWRPWASWTRELPSALGARATHKQVVVTVTMLTICTLSQSASSGRASKLLQLPARRSGLQAGTGMSAFCRR